ncbi:microneme protein MIC16 [Besnoitia besnoiti]|uniref:Microneme protein MIC16 n=1 Tax=Besnoitia besnoiti TaxID=94643 RepID=A0A2A9M2B3_BESBE|nr:microneme protein MIC16 [Besnoitia besnoiti]PFH32099.1 microneme protein MIC16 [Besnoitia besnoiti]
MHGGLLLCLTFFGVEAISRGHHPKRLAEKNLVPHAVVEGVFSGISHAETSDTIREESIPHERLQAFRNASPDFDRLYRFPAQVDEAQAKGLLSLQDGACAGLYWGKKELVSRITGTFTSLLRLECHESWFSYTEWARTKTWRECARTGVGSHQYFSWVRHHDKPDGACVLVTSVRSGVTRNDMEDCLVDVKSHKEVAVAGVVGEHSGCTSCQVAEWSETACDSWCGDGLQGRFRDVAQHTNSGHCSVAADSYCDFCPNLWEVRQCNAGTNCATGIKPGVRFCPEGAGKEDTADDWRDCAERCLRTFEQTGGDTGDPASFFEAKCFRYSFNNATSSCIFDHLHSCPDSSSISDPQWISGDILSMPSADFTTVTWHDWQEWSSCHDVDPAVGWKKRTRGAKTWGYRPDSSLSPSHWISVAPCVEGAKLMKSDLELAMNPETMCWVYSDFADWSTVSCEPECGENRKKTRTRRVRQTPVKQPDGSILESCASTEVSLQARQQTKECPGSVTCETGCTYTKWTAWSECRCFEGSAGRQVRARELLGGSQLTCTDLEEDKLCEKVCEGNSSTSTVALGGGIGVLAVALLGFVGYKCSRAVPTEQPRPAHM